MKTTETIAQGDALTMMHQIVDLLREVTGIDAVFADDNNAFEGVRSKQGMGILSVKGIVSGEVFLLTCRLLAVRRSVHIPAEILFNELQELGQIGTKYRLRIEDGQNDERILGVEVGIAPVPFSLIRLAQMKDVVERLGHFARTLQEHLPERIDDLALNALYKKVSEVLMPVIPLHEELSVPDALTRLAVDVLECLRASMPIALAVSNPLREGFFLSLVARMSRQQGFVTLGRLRLGPIQLRKVTELAAAAPGVLVFPVHQLLLSTSEQYEMKDQLRSFYAEIASSGKGLILTGVIDELQSTLNCGQGAVLDPLEPVIAHVNENIPFDLLIEHAVDAGMRTVGGGSQVVRRNVIAQIGEVLGNENEIERERLLPAVVRREVSLQQNGTGAVMPTREFVASIKSRRETFSGLGNTAVARRSSDVRQRMIDTFCDPRIEEYLNGAILAQEEAIRKLVYRLRQEILTRPDHQPVRVLIQGTPATGKSQASALLAKLLGWTHMTIDCGGIPDYYTFNSQLLGSGRGIVMSRHPGRLEIAARERVVLEVSDLDHAPAHIRAAIGDLFLLCMETGLGQSATGGVFNCANLLIVFTVNLPNRRDEKVHNAFGFHEADTTEAEDRVVREMLDIMSSAFLSRVGTPILFHSLSGETLNTIASNELGNAVKRAARNTGHPVSTVAVDREAAALIVERVRKSIVSFGARILLEQARSMVAEAYVEGMNGQLCTGHVRVQKKGNRIVIVPKDRSESCNDSSSA
ncbi:MAG: hypothetical protein KFH87_03965 [Bacteroidetes bacterium]|nr:hypothetical protein [Bacteroidota bacterium]